MALLGNLKHGLLFILSAPAGTGKTTLINMLNQEFPCIVPSLSSTTRQPRGEEINGVDYNFITKEEFLSRIEAGEFLEYVQLYGNYYGTSRVWVERRLDEGKHVVLVIDTQGAMLLAGKVNAIKIFVAPPSLEELERRLQLRKTETQEVIEQRLAWAKKELLAQQKYDYVVINDDLSMAYQILRSIFVAEEHRIRYTARG
ncbi:MAG: guanylate kinase [Parachlamydiaceae bacterium]